MQPRYWSAAWRKGGWLRLLSGATLPPSTLDRGAASWILSLRATRASPTASPAGDSETPTTDGCSIGCSASWTPSGLLVFSGRTYAGISTANYPSSFPVWRQWATGLRLEYSARRKSALPIGERGCSSWPTAKTSTGDYSYSRGDQNNPVLNLEGAAKQWPTVRACSGERSSGANRTELVEAWQTPSVADTTGGHASRGGERSGELLLKGQAAGFPSSHQARTTPDGPPSSNMRRTLNPLFVEWLMGWPSNWSLPEPQSTLKSQPRSSTATAPCDTALTDCAPAETASFRWLLRMRGHLSRLHSPREPDQPSLL